MSAIGLIINERSNRTRSVIDEILSVARRAARMSVEVLDGILGLDKAMIGMSRRGVDTLVLAGGDGTMQAAFTDAINNRRFETAPKFVALPCGMTNVIANDCGLKGSPGPSLDRFLKRREQGAVTPLRRNLLSLACGAREPIHGFFFGAGAFHSAVKFSRAQIQTAGAKRAAALAMSVGGYVLKYATDPAARKDAVSVEFSAGGPASGPARSDLALYLATTLSKLGSGIYPFWGSGAGAIAATAIEHPVRRILGAAPSVVRGRSLPWFEPYGYRSWRTDRIGASFEAPFVFDGEIFDARGHELLTFGTAHNVDFLH
jgi:hypothetical protein